MKLPHRYRWLTAIFLLLALLSLTTAGGLWLRQLYLTRGLPDGLPQPVAHGGPQVGINVYLGSEDVKSLEDELAAVKATGATAVRQPFYFQEPFDWAAADRLVEAVGQAGLILVPLLDGDPETDFAPPADPAVFAAWTGAFAERYGEQIDHYIIWDEPNLTSHWGGQPVNPAEYAALLTAAGQAIRGHDAGAVIVAAPLAPTVETGPQNLADPLFLRALYENGAASAFDVAAGKPYGFDRGPDDRTVDRDVLNFSRAILLREVMVEFGDGDKALWAGNWGWNSLPAGWTGRPSIWGQVDEATQADWTAAAVERARREWPWMGLMFLENWRPAAVADDARWGFSIAGRVAAQALANATPPDDVAYPGFHLAQDSDPAQDYEGGWRFSTAYGADISQSGDKVSLRFWGTDVGLLVRRADFRARLYATVDGRPANALPHDENGAALVLTAPDPDQKHYTLTQEMVATNLAPGEHTLELVASRGWDQWALYGFSVGYRPPATTFWLGMVAMGLAAVAGLGLAWHFGRRAEWGAAGPRLAQAYRQLGGWGQGALTIVVAALVALTGWLTWGQEAAGLYRRLGDGGQLALTAAAASIFYAAPSFFVYLAALLVLFVLIYFRPAWGLALVAFSFPFFVLPKPMLGYRFSPVEIFLLVTAAAFLLQRLTRWRSAAGDRTPVSPAAAWGRLRSRLKPADLAVLALVVVASLSLLFTERLDVASNEWRVVVIEPALFYFLLRWQRPEEREMHTILDAFVLGGLVVALIGLGNLATGRDLITAEGGLPRLQSIFGSPNNVALYLGRILPFLVAMALMGQGRRRLAYGLALVPVGLAILLTFSKGALFLGVPASLLVVVVLRQKLTGRPIWPWLVGAAAAAGLAVLAIWQIPQLWARLNPQGATGFLRLNLWRASLNMIADHPVFGVGLDNFLYAYRGRYILDAAWQEPDLNHPHNLVLDFATRLGLLGLLVGGWLLWAFWRVAGRLPRQVSPQWRPVAVGLLGSLANIIAHGLVDHSFFLVDLAFAFYLLLGAAVWLRQNQSNQLSSEAN
jgi:O-antigen ligase